MTNTLRSGSLNDYWLDRLSERMEAKYPDIIGNGKLTDHWKVDGWNDGTVTLYGVYTIDKVSHLCVFADYENPFTKVVTPRIEHTGWLDLSSKAV